MTPAERLLLEIETAQLRHDWAKAEMVHRGETQALAQFFKQSLEELIALKGALRGLLSPLTPAKIQGRRAPAKRKQARQTK